MDPTDSDNDEEIRTVSPREFMATIMRRTLYLENKKKAPEDVSPRSRFHGDFWPSPGSILVPNMIPGIGKEEILSLKNHNIDTVDTLVGHFFLCQRNEEAFKRFLSLTMSPENAQICASNISRKVKEDTFMIFLI